LKSKNGRRSGSEKMKNKSRRRREGQEKTAEGGEEFRR
jgi:hypothetical protein